MTHALGSSSRSAGVLVAALALSALVWTVVARADAPHLVKGPYLTGMSAQAVDVRFELDSAAPAEVEIAVEGDGGAPRLVKDAASAMHVVHVGGLEAGRTYSYDVRAEGGPPSTKGRFTTAPPDDSTATVKFLVYGDVRSDVAVHEALTRRMLDTPADFLVNDGDLVHDGGDADDWATFFRIERTLLRDRPIFLCIGNHELYDDQAGSNFARYFGYPDASGVVHPYGTMRWGDVRMFFLNGMHDWRTGPERQWLEKALASADHEPGLLWRFVVVHHSPWSSGPHGANTKLVEAHVPELLAEHGVDVLFAGHDHIYERGDAKLKYVLSGGGGAKLYDVEQRQPSTRKAEAAYHDVEVTVTPTALKLVATRIDGTVLDRCGFEKGKPWDCDAAPATPTAAGTPPRSDLPEPHPSTTTRCGCSLPGVPLDGRMSVALVVAALGLVALRRRRG